MKKSNFQLVSQRLLKVEFTVNKNYNPPKDHKIPINYSPQINVQKYDNENAADVFFKMEIFKNDGSDKYPFYINLLIKGYFKWNEGLGNIDNYLHVNAPAVLMSYLRSIVSQLTIQAGFPPLILPLINFTAASEPKK